MKTCSKCGKNVSDSAPFCPVCNCAMFHTNSGTEGLFSELMMRLLGKSPKLFFIIMTILGIGLIGVIVWFVVQFNTL